MIVSVFVSGLNSSTVFFDVASLLTMTKAGGFEVQ